MPVKGLQAADITLPRLKLPARKGIYFSAIVLSMWDNIHGPKIIAVWEGDESRGAVSEACEGKPTRDAPSTDRRTPDYSLLHGVSICPFFLSDLVVSTKTDRSKIKGSNTRNLRNYL